MTSMPTSTPGAPPGQEKKKSNLKGCLIAGCGGCLLLMLVSCCIGGYLFYLEEGVPYDAPGEEVYRMPFTPGQPISFTYTWEGTGYAFTRYYVEAPGATPYTTTVSGSFGCEEYGAFVEDPVSATYYGPPDGDHEGWIYLTDDYRTASPAPVPCRGTLNVVPPVPSATLVVTVRQRPSDWFSGI
jgi:hypothetical protein